ncbi:MAG: serine O-acetyltransferase [Pseudomonadota bacterium]
MAPSSAQNIKPSQLHALDPVWEAVRQEAQAIIDAEPHMSGFIYGTILNQKTLEDAIIQRICQRLHQPEFSADMIMGMFRDMREAWPEWSEIVRVDIAAVYDRDPACTRFVEPILYFKGFHALQTHRLAHWAWHEGKKDFALYLQSRSSQTFQTDINPQARFGRGIFMDHATGIVVGATAVVGDNVSIMQEVTLGGTGKEAGDRHPKVANGVLIGSGAKVLGNIEIGQCSRIAAGALVVKPVPPKSTVAGVPARVVGVAGCSQPSRTMDQILADPARADG